MPLPDHRPIMITIKDVENTARTRRDRTADIQIRGNHFLTVQYDQDRDCYRYTWKRAKLTRDGADMLLSEISEQRI